MADTYTVQDAHKAKMDQVKAVAQSIDNIRAQIEEIKHSELAGFSLWIGGLPLPLTQLDGMLQHNKSVITDTFPDAFTPEAPAAE